MNPILAHVLKTVGCVAGVALCRCVIKLIEEHSTKSFLREEWDRLEEKHYQKFKNRREQDIENKEPYIKDDSPMLVLVDDSDI